MEATSPLDKTPDTAPTLCVASTVAGSLLEGGVGSGIRLVRKVWKLPGSGLSPTPPEPLPALLLPTPDPDPDPEPPWLAGEDEFVPFPLTPLTATLSRTAARLVLETCIFGESVDEIKGRI